MYVKLKDLDMNQRNDNFWQWDKIFFDNQGSFITFNHFIDQNDHPLVIFYDEYVNEIYYLQMQTFEDQSFCSFDTSTIYRITLEDFIKKFDLYNNYKYSIFNPNDQFRILKQIYFNYKNDDIAYKMVELISKKDDQKISFEFSSYYKYVSEKYLIRTLNYKDNNIDSIDLDFLIKKFNLDVREQPLTYSAIGGLLNSSFYEFKNMFPDFISEVNEFRHNERKKEVERRKLQDNPIDSNKMQLKR